MTTNLTPIEAAREEVEMLVQQARTETAREIFNEIERDKWLCDGAGCQVICVDDDDPDWQHLKTKYLGGNNEQATVNRC